MAYLCLDLLNQRMIGFYKAADAQTIITNSYYKIWIKRFVESVDSEQILFKAQLTYIDIKKAVEYIEELCLRLGYTFEMTSNLKQFLSQKEFYIQEKYKVGNDIKRRHSNVLDKFNEFKDIVSLHMSRQLRDKQMWDAFFMTTMEKSSNFSVPGSGKTSSVLGMYAFLKAMNRIDKVVMIGPKNAFGSWIDEFNVCFDGIEELRVFNIHDSRYKTTKDKMNSLLLDTGNTNLFLFNYESLKRFSEQLQKIVSDRCLLVYDEVHKVKAIGGEYASHALDIAEHANYTVAMTGTPIPNSYTDIYNLLHLLYGNEYDSFFGFKPALLKNPNIMDIQLINEKIRPFFCRTNKKELGVPEPNPDCVNLIPATEVENRLFHILYQAYKGDKFKLLIRLLQLESNPKMLLKSLDLAEFRYIADDLVKNTDDIDIKDYSSEVVSLIHSISQTSKLRACIEKITQLISENKPIIVWCIFIDTMKHIKELLEKQNIKVMIINGEVELSERQEIIDGFKDGELQVLITNPHTLAESVSLHTVCHDAIYLEYSYNLVHLLQSKDRIHRLGLAPNQYTQYYYFMTQFIYDGEEYSLDEQIFNRLCEKEEVMLDAIDNNILEHVSSNQEDLDTIFEKLFK